MKVKWVALAVGVIAVGGLMVGTWQVAYGRGRDEGQTAVAASRDAFVQGRPGGAGKMIRVEKPVGGGAADGTAVQVEAVEGTIEKIDGKQATIKTGEGAVTVTLGDGAAIRRTEKLDAGTLMAGDKVVVFGQKGSDGAVTADAVEVQG